MPCRRIRCEFSLLSTLIFNSRCPFLALSTESGGRCLDADTLDARTPLTAGSAGLRVKLSGYKALCWCVRDEWRWCVKTNGGGNDDHTHIFAAGGTSCACIRVIRA